MRLLVAVNVSRPRLRALIRSSCDGTQGRSLRDLAAVAPPACCGVLRDGLCRLRTKVPIQHAAANGINEQAPTFQWSAPIRGDSSHNSSCNCCSENESGRNHSSAHFAWKRWRHLAQPELAQSAKISMSCYSALSGS